MTRLNDIRKRFEAATPGPWLVDGADSGHSQFEMERWIVTEKGDVLCDIDPLFRVQHNEFVTDEGEGDQHFIANARQDIEDLTVALEKIVDYVDDCREFGVPVRESVINTIVRVYVEKEEPWMM